MALEERNKEMITEIANIGAKYQDGLYQRMDESHNSHEKWRAVNDVLETMLYEVNRQIPREKYKDVDNTPKHLLYLTEEDL